MATYFVLELKKTTDDENENDFPAAWGVDDAWMAPSCLWGVLTPTTFLS